MLTNHKVENAFRSMSAIHITTGNIFKLQGSVLPKRLALWVKFSADDILKYFFLFFPENMFRHFLQIVSSGDNLHEMLKRFL